MSITFRTYLICGSSSDSTLEVGPGFTALMPGWRPLACPPADPGAQPDYPLVVIPRPAAAAARIASATGPDGIG